MVKHVDAQRALEQRAEVDWLRVEHGQVEARTVARTPDAWELHVGPHRLLLVPSTKEWLYYDALHDTWESTGLRAGEAVFRSFDGVLEAHPRG